MITVTSRLNWTHETFGANWIFSSSIKLGNLKNIASIRNIFLANYSIEFIFLFQRCFRWMTLIREFFAQLFLEIFTHVSQVFSKFSKKSSRDNLENSILIVLKTETSSMYIENAYPKGPFKALFRYQWWQITPESPCIGTFFPFLNLNILLIIKEWADRLRPIFL